MPVHPADAGRLALSDLEATLRSIRTDLDTLAARRRAGASAAQESWRGGRRNEFDERLAALERQAARVADDLERFRRLVRRRGEDVGWPA